MYLALKNNEFLAVSVLSSPTSSFALSRQIKLITRFLKIRFLQLNWGFSHSYIFGSGREGLRSFSLTSLLPLPITNYDKSGYKCSWGVFVYGYCMMPQDQVTESFMSF